MATATAGLWDGFILPDNCEPRIAREKLNEYCDGLMSQELKDTFNNILEVTKKEVIRTGGDWNISGPSIENMLRNFRDCVRSSIVPDEVLGKLPLSAM